MGKNSGVAHDTYGYKEEYRAEYLVIILHHEPHSAKLPLMLYRF